MPPNTFPLPVAPRHFEDYIPGDVLSLRVTVIEANRSRSKPDRGIIRSDIQVLNQQHAVVMTMKALIFLSCREVPGMNS